MGLPALIELGDIALTAPLALAIAAWLGTTRGWRAALGWCALFALAIALVGASKIAYLGWGKPWPALHFQALSGHATGVMAVFPLLLFLLLQGYRPLLRRLAAGAGIALGIGVAVLLVLWCQHTLSEVLAGALLGTLAGMGGILLAAPGRTLAPARTWLLSGLVFAGAAWIIGFAPLSYWLFKSARLLTAHSATHSFQPGSLE
jgi:membrane-associated phospholipid phosphatase